MSNLPPGFVIWITGLPASGKSSLAKAIHDLLAEEKILSVILDANDLRALLTPEPEYSDAERRWFYHVLTELAVRFARQGVNVIIAATGNRRLYREQARCQSPVFAEVYLDCPLLVCQSRDPKGQYLTEAGADRTPGIGVAYEASFAPEVVVNTAVKTPVEAAYAVIDVLKLEHVIRGDSSHGDSQSFTHREFTSPL
ncbi:MAG: adenylyl-sulfate kinase [Anaerolineales bacterium]|nr:adenylyl-sulfate kinase [Anaerolineales bacterium]